MNKIGKIIEIELLLNNTLIVMIFFFFNVLGTKLDVYV